MAKMQTNGQIPEQLQKALLYHFCRLRLPELTLSLSTFEHHLQRCYALFSTKLEREGKSVTWGDYLENIYSIDWFLCCACLERSQEAWELLFASRANRSDCLLVDALRARAARLFPTNEEKQEMAVMDFWGYLLAGEKEGTLPILARYDGQRPLVPWLIRVFQNRQISELRAKSDEQPLLEEEIENSDFPLPLNSDGRWNEEFRDAARQWLGTLKEQELLLLGLRHRYRLSQRQVATILSVHEGNVSRQFSKLADRFMEEMRQSLIEAGWTGEDLNDFIRQEMGSVLTEEPRLSADHLAALLSARGKSLEEVLSESALSELSES